MADTVNIPDLLMNKIKRQRPDIFDLLTQLESARSEGDANEQKRIRKQLRNEGFYLSRLKDGEDPFVHASLWGEDEPANEPVTYEETEEVLLTEDEVVLNLSTWLEKQGWGIVTQCLGHQQGIDILAVREGQTLIVEAKGAKGSKDSPVTRRERFSSGQIKSHFGRAIVKCLEDQEKNLGARVAIAQPDDTYMRDCLKHVLPSMKRIGIDLYWVAGDGSVEVEECF